MVESGMDKWINQKRKREREKVDKTERKGWMAERDMEGDREGETETKKERERERQRERERERSTVLKSKCTILFGELIIKVRNSMHN